MVERAHVHTAVAEGVTCLDGLLGDLEEMLIAC